jgi:hypothetical protein
MPRNEGAMSAYRLSARKSKALGTVQCSAPIRLQRHGWVVPQCENQAKDGGMFLAIYHAGLYAVTFSAITVLVASAACLAAWLMILAWRGMYGALSTAWASKARIVLSRESGPQ